MSERQMLKAVVVSGALVLFGWRELAALRADGPTQDESAHLEYGERGLTQGTFARLGRFDNSKMPVSVLNAVPVVAAAEQGWALSERQRLALARLPTVLLG